MVTFSKISIFDPVIRIRVFDPDSKLNRIKMYLCVIWNWVKIGICDVIVIFEFLQVDQKRISIHSSTNGSKYFEIIIVIKKFIEKFKKVIFREFHGTFR